MAVGDYDFAKLTNVTVPGSTPISASFLIGQRCIPRCDLYVSSDEGETWQVIQADITSGTASIPTGHTAADLDGKAIGLGIWMDSPDSAHPYAVTASLVSPSNAAIQDSRFGLSGNGQHEVIWGWLTWVVKAQ